MTKNNNNLQHNYYPQPQILSLEKLPKELIEILNMMARNVHERWAAGRIADGWKYGHERNDQKKEHPTLVPYEELPELEKEYDRQTVMATLSYLIDNGYEIKRKEHYVFNK